MSKLTIRKNGEYYQIGSYEKGKWVQEAQLGTAEQALDMVREWKRIHTSST